MFGPSGGYLTEIAFISPPGHTLWGPKPQTVTRTVMVSSYTNSLGECGHITPMSMLGKPYEALVDLDTLFTPPFHVAPVTGAAACCGDCNGDGTVTINEIITGVNAALSGCPSAATTLSR
jgi:hypothetical protein